MLDFKRFYKIQIKRNGIWFLALAILLLIVQVNHIQESIEHINYRIVEDKLISDLIIDGIDFGDDPNYYIYENNIPIRTDEILPENYIEEILKTQHLIENLNDEKAIEYGGQSSDYFYYLSGNKINLSQNNFDFFKPNSLFLFVVGFLAFLLTSLEHLTPYYEFSRTFPWSNRKSYLMKVLLGLIIITILYFIILGINYSIVNNSNIQNIYTFEDTGLQVFLNLGYNLGVYLLSLGLGTLAGNFLGHIGLLIIGVGGIELIFTNIQYFRTNILGIYDDYSYSWFFDLNEKIPLPIRAIINPMHYNYDGSFKYFYSQKHINFIILGIFIGLFAFAMLNRIREERTGMLVLNKAISNYTKVLAILSTTMLIHSILNATVFYSSGLGLNLIIMLILGFLVSKFYNFLFNARIGV